MPSRRTLLAALAASAGTALAGCTNAPGPPNDGADGSPDDEPTPDPRTDAPDGPGVEWTQYLGPAPVTAVTATADGVYAVGGTNGRATPNPNRDYLRPESSRNLVALETDGTRRWRYEAPAGVFGPVPAADGVYATVGWSAGTHGVDNRVVRVVDGEQQWATDSVGRYLNVLATADGAAFVGTADDQRGLSGESLFSLAADGTERWRVEAGDAATAAVHEGSLYLPFADRQLVAFDTDTGGRRWTASGGLESSPPHPVGDQVYLDSEEQVGEGYPIRAIDARDATERWSFVAATDDDSPFVPTGAVRQGDTVYVTEYGGTLFALDAADGTEQWRYRADGDTRDRPFVVDDTVYLGAFDDGVHAVATSGERRWQRPLDGPVRLRGADADGVVAAAGEEGGDLVAFGPDGNQRWRFTAQGRPRATTTVGSRVYLGTEAGFLVALDG
jgi:outer membrane protein assembly factor BamB